MHKLWRMYSGAYTILAHPGSVDEASRVSTARQAPPPAGVPLIEIVRMGIIADTLTRPLYDSLIARFPADREYTRNDLTSESIPFEIRYFLEQLLMYQTRREARRIRRAQTDWVDHEHPAFQQAQDDFFDSMARYVRIPRSAWGEALQQAVQHTSAYLVRPTPTVVNFVFGDQEDAITLDKVQRRMDFFSHYTYLHEAVTAYAKQRKVDTFERDHLGRLLAAVDERISAGYGTERWIQLLQPLFSLSQAAGHSGIPVGILRIVFEEKRVVELQRRLQHMIERQGVEHIDQSALERLLSVAEAEPEPEPPSSKAVWRDVATSKSDWAFSTAPAPVRAGGEKDTPLWQAFRSNESGADSIVEASESAQPLWARFRSRRDAEPERRADYYNVQPSPDVEAIFGARSQANEAVGVQQATSHGAPEAGTNGSSGTSGGHLDRLERNVLGQSDPPRRSIYVQELFGGSMEDYEYVLGRLNRADTWGVASQIIAQDVFRAHRVNIYSDSAVHFTNAVEARFRAA